MDSSTITEPFLALSPGSFGSFITSPPPPTLSAHDFAFAQLLSESSSSLSFPQASHEYPPLAMSPELLALFGPSEMLPTSSRPAPAQFMVSQDMSTPSHPIFSLSFTPDLLTFVTPTYPQQSTITNPHLDIKCEPSDAPWLSYMQEVLSHPLPFQSPFPFTLTSSALPLTISPRDTIMSCTPQPSPMSIPTYAPQTNAITQDQMMIIKQEQQVITTPQSSALQKLHQRLLQRLRKSQQDGGVALEPESLVVGCTQETQEEQAQQAVVSESSKKADSSFNKVLELFSYYFNTQKTASPLACTALRILYFSRIPPVEIEGLSLLDSLS